MDARLPTPVPAADGLPAPLQRLMALPMRSRITLAAATLALTALIAWGVQASRQPDWRILYAALPDKDGGAVIAALGQMNVPHRMGEGGTAILVPADQVHEVRLKLASQGLPKGGTVGFELMENQKFGTTQFQERLNFQRGLEGELARSIMALSAVQSARVHLALPNQTAFLREQQKPSASVLLQLYGGRTLDRNQVAGIVHLVASSVPEMPPQSVSVVDQTGALLSSNDSKVAGLDEPQLLYVRQAEQRLQQRILAILEPMVGPGNVRAQVTADIDFSQAESTAETYGPNQGGAPSAVRSQHLSEAPGASAGGVAGGSPGALSNQPAQTPASNVNGAPGALTPATAATAGGPVKRDAVTTYEVDRTVKTVRHATGNIRRLSAAVIVNNMVLVGADGKPGKATPLPPAQMEQVNALVREAIGFNKDRGDSVQVVNAPFTTAAEPVPEPVPLWRDPELLGLARSLGPWVALPLLGLLVILGLVRPALRSGRPPAPLLAATVQDPIELGAPAGKPAGPAVRVEPDPDAPPLLPTAQAAKQQARTAQLDAIRQLATQDPATVANVVRSWATPAT